MRFLQTFLLSLLALTASAQQSDKVKLLGNWSDTAHIRITPAGQRYNDVWGFKVHGKEYAVIGSTEGAHIIDVDLCKQVCFYPGKDSGPYIIHRDYKTYKNYLYAVCDEGYSSLQVFDLNYLPDSLHLVYEFNPLDVFQAHNIFIDTAKATLYACSVKGFSTSDFLRVYSIADPLAPVLLTKYNLHDKVHDVFVRNDTAYCSSSFYGFEVVDFTSHDQNYQNIGEMHFYPYQGYNHSSWIREDGIGVMADETHGMPLKVIDTRDLLNIRVMSNFMPRPLGDLTCIPHNPFIVGNFVFISYYFDGLQIYDITDPVNPVRAGYYDTYPDSAYQGYAGAWGCYPFLPSGRVLISDMQTGLYVFDVSAAVKKADTPVIAVNTIKIFPVPAAESLNVQLPLSDTGAVTLMVHDVSGRKIRQYSSQWLNNSIQPIHLTLPGYLSAGTYFISIKTGAHFYKEKFTKR